MATESLSSLTQSIGHAGYLVLSFADITGITGNVAVSFIPTLAHMTQPQPAPLQQINIAVGGQVHIYQVSPAESLTWTLAFHDLPFFDDDPLQPATRPTQGYQSLQSFIRTTLNYSEQLCTVMTPDGMIETMRYLGGLETFEEAVGLTQKAQRWTGQVLFTRVIP